MRIKAVYLIFLLSGLVLVGCGNSGNAQQQAGFTTVQKGEVSPYKNTPAQVSVIRNNTEWASFWDQLYTNYSPKPNLPSINFSERIIIAVVDAAHATGGYTITITSIQSTSAGITVNAQQVSPGPSCLVTQSFAQPFHIVIVPTFPGEATLALSQSVTNCGQ